MEREKEDEEEDGGLFPSYIQRGYILLCFREVWLTLIIRPFAVAGAPARQLASLDSMAHNTQRNVNSSF